MKELLLFLCTIATSPECYNNPKIIVIDYPKNQMRHKIAQESAAELIQQNRINGWLIGYDCGEGVIYVSPKEKPIIVIPDDETIG